MKINSIILFSIVGSVIAGNQVQGGISDDEFTLEQFEGSWYHMGSILPCHYGTRACRMIQIFRKSDSDRNFYFCRVMIENIRGCAYGVPIPLNFAEMSLDKSTLRIANEDLYSIVWATIKSYNNGTELIFSHPPRGKYKKPFYRLWSQKREVSEETKAEFEKLAENATVRYNSWDDCPKLRTETDDEFTLEQFEGLWYDIAKIYYGKLDISTCTTNNVSVDYENKTFNITSITIERGSQIHVNCIGKIVESVLHLKGVSADGNSITGMIPAEVFSCNNGTELIFSLNGVPNYGLLSRNSEVSKETLEAFKTLQKYVREAKFIIYGQVNCPNRIK